jgi:hypothetical protein
LVNGDDAFFNAANFVITFLGVVYLEWHLTEIVTMLVVSRFLTVIIHYSMCASFSHTRQIIGLSLR